MSGNQYLEVAGYDPYDNDTGSFFGSIGHAISGAAKSVSHAVSSVGKTAMKGARSGGKSLPDPLSKVPVLGTIVHAAGTFVTSPLSLTHAILSGERIDHALIADFKRNIGAVKEIAPYV